MTETTTKFPANGLSGLSVGHGCSDCFELRITPAAVNTCGASYELTASIVAGHGPDRGHVYVLTDDLPAVISELQRIYGEAKDATSIPADWPVHD